MSEAGSTFDPKQRLAEAEALLSQARELAARFAATEAAIGELSMIWNDPKAVEYRTKFEASRGDVDAFVKGSAEYVAFLKRLSSVGPEAEQPASTELSGEGSGMLPSGLRRKKR